MGSTNFTEHFDIPLPLGSDKTTPMDYNQSMQAVDTALFAAQGDASDAKTGLAATNQKVTQNTQAINSLAGRVTTVEGTVSSQGTALSNLSTKIDGVEEDAQDMITAYKQASATASRNYAIGDYFIYNDVLYKATQNIASGATIVPNTNCRATNVGTELERLNSDLDSAYTLAGSAKTRADEAYDAATNGDTIVATWINALSNINGKFARIGYVHHLQFSARIAGGIGAGMSNIGQIAEVGNYPSVHVVAPITTNTGYSGNIQIGTNGAISIEFPQPIPDCSIVANLVY